ncbi:hypothetical protein VTK56DRAFT_207 [Thermocarpiscus australiensis]
MAESSKSAADKNSDAPHNPQSSSGSTVTSEQLRAMIRAAMAQPKIINPSWPAPTGVSGPVAMEALLDMEEEALQEELQDPRTTEEERERIRAQLNGMQTPRRWFNFMRTMGPPSTNPRDGSRSDDTKLSKTGKEPEPSY